MASGTHKGLSSTKVRANNNELLRYAVISLRRAMRVGAAAVGRLHICCIYQRFTLAIVLFLVPCRLVQPLLWFVQDAAPFDQVQY